MLHGQLCHRVADHIRLSAVSTWSGAAYSAAPTVFRIATSLQNRALRSFVDDHDADEANSQARADRSLS